MPAVAEGSDGEAPERRVEEGKKKKKLVLQDGEILQMYSLAQKEAELEADWRGIDYMARKVPHLLSIAGENRAVPGAAGPTPRSLDSSRRKERREAIELL